MAEPSQFWTFSLAVYADAAVQKECLDLQDRFAVDVNLLLFCAFVGAVHGALFAEADVDDVVAAVRDWHQNVVTNLRGARRALKPFAAAQSAISASAEALRDSVKAAELEAERIEQTVLEAWFNARIERFPRAEPAEAVAVNIRGLLARYGSPNERPQLPEHLVAAALVARARWPMRRLEPVDLVKEPNKLT